MLWMRHRSDIHYMDNNRYGQQPMLWIDHIFIIWTTTDVMDETH